MKQRKRSIIAGQARRQAFECRVDNRGRITIPVAVREHMHLEPGDRIEFAFRPMGQMKISRALPDQYYAVLKRLQGTLPRNIDLEF